MLSPPHLSDKLIDWRLIEQAGGQELLADKDVIDFGPSYGLDMITWSYWAKSYTVVESAPDVLEHIRLLRRCFPERNIRIIEHDMREPWPEPLFSIEGYDVAIDFGTFDNLISWLQPYGNAWQLLRPGGRLFTTFANRDYFKEPISPAGDEHRFTVEELLEFFKGAGGLVTTAMNANQPRAGLVVKKL